MSNYNAGNVKWVKDGNQWCLLHGETLQTGYAAFGDTPEQTKENFEKEYGQPRSGRIRIPKRIRGINLTSPPAPVDTQEDADEKLR